MDYSKLNFRNVTEEMKKYVVGPEYCDLTRSVTHDRLTQLTKASLEANARAKATGDETHVPYAASDAVLQHIHDSFLRHELGRLGYGDEYLQLKQRFEDVVWADIAPRARVNPGMTQFLLEQGVHSSLIIPFMYNEQHCLAKAVLPAHFVGYDALDQPTLILPTDAMFPFCRDQSYRMIDGRTVKAQEIMKRSKRVLLAGGGLAPELWTNGYPFGQLGQEVVICDTDASLVPHLEKLLGGKLEDFGIKFWNCNVLELAHNAALREYFDCIVANGFMSYHTANPQELEEIFSTFSYLLMPGGVLFFDTQNKHPVLYFDVLAMGWPQGMDTMDGPDAAAALLDPYLERHGFVGVQHSVEAHDPALGESPAGTFTMAKKAD